MNKNTLWVIIMFIFTWIYFKSIFYFNITSDFKAHIEFIIATSKSKTPPVNFLYYLTVYLFALGNTSLVALQNATVMVLSLSVTAKFWITRRILKKSITTDLKQSKGKSKTKNWVLNLSTLSLCLAFNLPNFLQDNYYLGQIPPNVWHNSTVIFLMPFALLLFWQSTYQIQNPTTKRFWIIVLLILLNLLIKPSFILVFIPAYTLILLYQYGISKKFFWQCIPVLIAFIGLVIEYLFIFFINANTIYENTGPSKVVIQPFWAWSKYSNCIPFSLIISLFYIIIYLSFYWKESIRSITFKYTGLIYVACLMIFILFAEIGPRQMHGNFSWQNISGAYFLFLACISQHLQIINKQQKLTKKDYILFCCFGLHVLTGILYMIRLILKDTYY